jgi:HSP20 family protein
MAADLERLMQSLFLPAASRVRDVPWRPPTDVYRTPYGWLVKFDLAGVRPEDVRLHAEGSRLTIRGTRRDASLEEGCSCYLMEIAYSRFERTVELPADLENADIRAEHREGMVLVRIVPREKQ